MNSSSTLTNNTDYQQWLADLKQGFRQRQIKAAVAVNRELLEFYWQLGESIVERQQHSQWGDGFLTQLSADLMSEFPDVKGFSKRNLEEIRHWYRFWSADSAIAQQAVAQLVQVPWGHNLLIITKSQSPQEALFYIQQTLPPLQSDLAQQSLKDPYAVIFGFLHFSGLAVGRALRKATLSAPLKAARTAEALLRPCPQPPNSVRVERGWPSCAGLLSLCLPQHPLIAKNVATRQSLASNSNLQNMEALR